MIGDLACYTIGHSKHSIEEFVELLKHEGIDFIIDVRSVPYSRFAPQFNLKTIESRFSEYKIAYKYMGDVIGGRFKEPEFLDHEGRVDFLKAAKGERFQQGLESVVSTISGGKRVAIMCTEKDPLNCHRFLLISHDLSERGIRMIHIMADGIRIENERWRICCCVIKGNRIMSS